MIKTMTGVANKTVRSVAMVVLLQVDGGIKTAFTSTSTTTMEDQKDLFHLIEIPGTPQTIYK